MKRISLIAGSLLSGMVLFASPLTPGEALERATGNVPMKARALSANPMQLRHTAKTALGAPSAYIFSPTDNKGFVIVSADDVALPVLGYSDEAFDPNNLPPSLEWWLQVYANQMEGAEKVNKAADDNSVIGVDPSWHAIAPLVKTKWDQDAPYNGECPYVGNVQCPTGCVATSLAQCMNYFQHPRRGTGMIRYKWDSKTLLLNLEKQDFEWDKMIDYYSAGTYTDEQAAAVAYLMKAAGYSVEMFYTPSASGAVSSRIVEALKTYFDYDKNVTYEPREIYSTSEWTKKIYDNLLNCGPVIYNGTSMAGGHSFVCDGYDGAGYFHINWGWGGNSDGYFVLDALAPSAQGTGGGVGGFNLSQDALLGMQKPTGAPEKEILGNLYQYGAATAKVEGSRIMFSATGGSMVGWGNIMGQDVSVYVGVKITDKDGGGTPTYVTGGIGSTSGVVFLNTGRIYSATNMSLQINKPKLADGEYKLTLATRDSEIEDAPWQDMEVAYGYPNYVYLTVKDGEYTITNVDVKTLSILNAELATELYNGKYTKVKATIENPSEYQLNQSVCPALVLNGKTQMVGENILVTLNPGQTVEKEWITKFSLVENADKPTFPQEYTLQLYNPENNIVYGEYGTVTMEKAPVSTTLKLVTLAVEGAPQESVEIDGRTYNDVYVVRDGNTFTVDLEYTCSKGYFDSNVSVGIYRKMDGGTALIPVMDGLYSANPFLHAGESVTAQIPVDFEDASGKYLYYIRVNYVKGGVTTYMGQSLLSLPTSGVEGIEADASETETEYYNMQGIRINEPIPGVPTIVRRNGKAEVKVVR